MSAIAEFAILAGSFPLGRVFEGHTDVTVELEQLVPTTRALIPYIWIRGADDDEQRQIQAALEVHPEIRDVTLVDRLEGDYLLRVEWEPEYTGILQAIARAPVALISATGNSEEWVFEVRGDEREDIATFHEYCREHDLPVTLRELHSLSRTETGTAFDLTDAQREALVLAYRRGYYRTPRETTLQEMADELDISGQALGARLRGGLHRLLGSTLDGPVDSA